MSGRQHIILLVVVAVVLSVIVIGLSVTLLPDAPINPTPTYPEGIDFPDERDVPRR